MNRRGSSAIGYRLSAIGYRLSMRGDALVDPMFEIPVEIVRSVIDYKPYDKNPQYDGRYMLLEGLDTPWWKRWTVGG